jgi:hypothetical protein
VIKSARTLISSQSLPLQKLVCDDIDHRFEFRDDLLGTLELRPHGVVDARPCYLVEMTHRTKVARPPAHLERHGRPHAILAFQHRREVVLFKPSPPEA